MSKSSICLYVFVLSAFLMSRAFGGEAVDRFNVDLGVAGSVADTGNSAGLIGEIDMPMGPYAGSRVTQSFNRFRGDDNYVDYEGYETGVGFFAGHHSIGRVGVDYGTGETEYDFEYAADATIESDTIRTYIEGYAGPVTLSYRRDDIEQDTDSLSFRANDYDISVLSASVYPIDNLRLGLRDYGADADDIKSVGAEYLVGRIASLYARYSNNDDNSDSDAFTIGVIFYIRGGATLIENDRHY